MAKGPEWAINSKRNPRSKQMQKMQNLFIITEMQIEIKRYIIIH